MQAWVGGERLHLGAEAEVISGAWYGRPAILKKRRQRGWRHPDLDKSLTSKRMTNEIKLTIWLAEKGALVPAIWDVDLDEASIIMERIDGSPLIEVLRSGSYDNNLLNKVGRAIRFFHRNAVNHGDLSTNNILITDEGEAVLIDLGLATREYELEGLGIDLSLIHI